VGGGLHAPMVMWEVNSLRKYILSVLDVGDLSFL
jgi:hypothetical protein